VNILVLAWAIPATTNMPGSPRLFSLCRHLSRSHRLTLVTFAGDESRLQSFRDDPESDRVFEDIVVLPRLGPLTWWRRKINLLRWEMHWGTRFRDPSYHADVHRRIRELVVARGFDVVYVDGLATTQYVVGNDLPCPAVADLHDCLTLLAVRKAQAERRWARKFRFYVEARMTARWEKALSRWFGAVLTNSDVDERYLRSLDPSLNVVIIGNGVDGDFFAPGTHPEDTSNLVFTGVMAYGPNEDAAVHFAEDILPRVQRRRPEARFHIVGAAPTERVRALGARPGVVVVGKVPDMRPHLEAAGVFVCPLRFGTGVKNKLLVALSMEKAAVATHRSAEGLDLRDGVDILLADRPEEFAAKVVHLMEDPDHARRLGRAGRERVTNLYSWRTSGQALEDVLLGAVDEAETPGRPSPGRSASQAR